MYSWERGIQFGLLFDHFTDPAKLYGHRVGNFAMFITPKTRELRQFTDIARTYYP
jgi:hypothetical protein